MVARYIPNPTYVLIAITNPASSLLTSKNSVHSLVLVLCSVSNQEKMLHEMKRVVKINGKIILLEHVLSKNKLIAFFEHLHNPITRFLFGFEINRDTINSIKKSGLKIVKEKNIGLVDIFKELVVKKQ